MTNATGHEVKWSGRRTFAAVVIVLTVVAGAVSLAIVLRGGGQGEPPMRTVLGDFETTLSPWGQGSAAAPPGGLTIARSPVAHGRGALKATVRLGVCIPADTHTDGTCKRYHSNAVLKTRHYEGEDSWWAWSMYFPDDWSPNVLSWNLLAQFHPPATPRPSRCQPNISLGTAGPGRLFVRSRGGADCASGSTAEAFYPPGALGSWHRLVWHVRFASGDDGLLEAWWDGVKVASLVGPTLYGDLRYAYGPILGIYEGGTGAVAQSVFYDYVVRGNSYEAVAGLPAAPR